MEQKKLIYIVLLLAIGYMIFVGPENIFSDNAVEIPATPASNITAGCQENTCNGTFTGVTDDKGCKVYGLEICNAATDCKAVGGKIVCDPQPFVNGCTWKTSDDFGKTYFTEFKDCGLNTEEICGKSVKYRCTKDPSILCDMKYDQKTNTFIKGCGGYLT